MKATEATARRNELREFLVTLLRFQAFGDDRTLILLPPADAQSERLLARMGRVRVGRASARR